MSDKRKEKGAQRRKVIIDAAINCIATRGLCDTTLDRVAEIANVSRTLVVFHFKSKKEMLAIVLDEINARYDREWVKIIEKSDISSKDRLLKLINFDIRLPIEHPELISVWHSFWGEARGIYNEFSSSRDQKYKEDINKIINLIIIEGEYEDIEAEIITSALVAMLFGFWWEAHLNPKPEHYENCMKTVIYFLNTSFPNHFKSL